MEKKEYRKDEEKTRKLKKEGEEERRWKERREERKIKEERRRKEEGENKIKEEKYRRKEEQVKGNKARKRTDEEERMNYRRKEEERYAREERSRREDTREIRRKEERRRRGEKEEERIRRRREEDRNRKRREEDREEEKIRKRREERKEERNRNRREEERREERNRKRREEEREEEKIRKRGEEERTKKRGEEERIRKRGEEDRIRKRREFERRRNEEEARIRKEEEIRKRRREEQRWRKEAERKREEERIKREERMWREERMREIEKREKEEKEKLIRKKLKRMEEKMRREEMWRKREEEECKKREEEIKEVKQEKEEEEEEEEEIKEVEIYRKRAEDEVKTENTNKTKNNETKETIQTTDDREKQKEEAKRKKEEGIRRRQEEEAERKRRLEEIRRRREEELQMIVEIQNKYQQARMWSREANTKEEEGEEEQNKGKKVRGKRRKRRPSSSYSSPLSERERRQREEIKTHKYKYNFHPYNSKVYLLLGKGSASEGLAGWRVKGDSKVVQLHPETNAPFGKSYRFDRVFMKASNRTIYSLGLQESVHYFCSSQRSVAVILYGPSHTGKSRYLRGPAGHPKGILQRAFADILAYVKAVKSYFCMLRVSYVEIYNENVEDLLVTDTYSSTSAPPPTLRLATDTAGRVVWCGAREVTVTKMEEVEDLYSLGHSEHIKRARKTKGRLEASHTIFRIILESLPRFQDYSSWDKMAVAVSFLDFVMVASLELLPILENVTDELRGGPTLTRSLYTFHHFVVDHSPEKNMLYDGRQTVLTRILREALVGSSHSLFLCSCSLSDTKHTLATLRFGEAAAWLVQHPTSKTYTNSILHSTISKVFQCHHAVRQALYFKNRTSDGSPEEELQSDFESAVKQEVRKMLALARNIFPLNIIISSKRTEIESDNEPVMPRKRGRPRKYPIRPKPFIPERPTKIDYISLWKSRYLNSQGSSSSSRDAAPKKQKEEKFYMAGRYDLTTTSKRHGLRHLYRTGSLRTSDPSTYYGGYLQDLLKEEEKKEKDGKSNKQKQCRPEDEEEERTSREEEEEEGIWREQEWEEWRLVVEKEGVGKDEEEEEGEGKEKEEEGEGKKEEEGKGKKEGEGKKEEEEEDKGKEEEEDGKDKEKEEGRSQEHEEEEMALQLREEDLLKIQEQVDEKEKQPRVEGFVNYVKGCITITRKWDTCVEDVMTQYLAEAYELKSYAPKKVSFSLRNMVYRDLKWKLDDGYVHFLRLSLWIQYFRDTLAERDKAGRLVYSMPDFIALKEVFLDLYLTPYRRNSRLWRMKAVSFEDGRVYIQSDRTIARTPEKLSPKVAFNAHLMGLCPPDTDDSSKERKVVPFPGEYWQVCWGEVDGLGLFYSSQVDMIDHSCKITAEWVSGNAQLEKMMKKVLSKRHFMYRTHLYQPPRDTGAWREKMWFTLLEWWADYQFGKVPNIIGGEVEGQEVTAIRLYCPQTLPQLAEAWCDKPAWDTGLCERYLSSVLRFIKYWCNMRPREILSFELQENGDVLCCKRRFKIPSRHFLVNNILPDEFIRDVYPAPPPRPKPSWPGKRGRKCKPRVILHPTRPRRIMCYWKLPRYCEVETQSPQTPPRYVFRPKWGKEDKDTQNWGSQESANFSFFPDPGWWRLRKEWAKHHRKGKHSKPSHRKKQHSHPKPTPHRSRDPKRLTAGLTRAQISRSVDKRARDWYKSTVPADSFPKSFIFENKQQGLDMFLSSSEDESEGNSSSKRNEILFAPLPKRKLRPVRHKRRKRRQSEKRPPIREDDEAYENLEKYIQPIIGPDQRKIPRLKGMQRIKKVYPVPPVPEDDASYVKRGKKIPEPSCQENILPEMLTQHTDSEGTDMTGVL